MKCFVKRNLSANAVVATVARGRAQEVMLDRVRGWRSMVKSLVVSARIVHELSYGHPLVRRLVQRHVFATVAVAMVVRGCAQEVMLDYACTRRRKERSMAVSVKIVRAHNHVVLAA